MPAFRDLPKDELQAFEAIAVNRDQGHPLPALAALMRRGFIFRERDAQNRPTGRFAVPILLHKEWCEWCAEHYDDEGRPKRQPNEKPAPALDPGAAIGTLPGLEGGGRRTRGDRP